MSLVHRSIGLGRCSTIIINSNYRSIGLVAPTSMSLSSMMLICSPNPVIPYPHNHHTNTWTKVGSYEINKFSHTNAENWIGVHIIAQCLRSHKQIRFTPHVLLRTQSTSSSIKCTLISTITPVLPHLSSPCLPLCFSCPIVCHLEYASVLK
jgi:hypothetical protein